MFFVFIGDFIPHNDYITFYIMIYGKNGLKTSYVFFLPPYILNFTSSTYEVMNFPKCLANKGALVDPNELWLMGKCDRTVMRLLLKLPRPTAGCKITHSQVGSGGQAAIKPATCK